MRYETVREETAFSLILGAEVRWRQFQRAIVNGWDAVDLFTARRRFTSRYLSREETGKLNPVRFTTRTWHPPPLNVVTGERTTTRHCGYRCRSTFSLTCWRQA